MEVHREHSYDTTESIRVAANDPAMLEHFNQFGYAVIGDVLDNAEVAHAKSLLWEFLESPATGLGWQRGQPSTWTDESLLTRPALHHAMSKGLFNSRGAGQSDFLWYIRTHPKVRATFESVWDTTELLSSFDGFNVFRPWHHGFMKTEGGWFHVDQGRSRKGFQCAQGMVALTKQDATTGGLIVVPKSHTAHEQLSEQAQDDTDYIEVPQQMLAQWKQQPRLVTCREGDLILWDSRCVHCNAPASCMPSSPATELLRAVAYVCMTPRKLASEKDLRIRRDNYKLHVTTSHWPHINVCGFGWARAQPLCYDEAPRERQALI
eukprot:TRINITY_DN28775_c0_g1_i1.p1 TRINITY_DN28775_c0_g1~~TRINITY_DN28775_c0_g1_i1.p1  ORF type:complete len:340 (+),score=18.35 TRINITY_DN28775_c0_g1_i1:63-1022(+)